MRQSWTPLALVALLVGACEHPPTAVTPAEAPALAVARDAERSGFAVFPIQLRAADGSPSTAWGELVVRVGTRLPPNPCGPDDALSGVQVVTFCGVVHNPDGEALQSIGFQVTYGGAGDFLGTASGRFTLPPNPCTTARLQGALALTGGGALSDISGVATEIVTSAGSLVGTSLGPPTSPTGSSSLPPNPCLIGIAVI